MGGNLRVGRSAHWHARRLGVRWPGELVRSNLGPQAAGKSEGGVALRRLAAECGRRRIVGGPVPTCSPAGWPRSRPHSGWQAAWSLDAREWHSGCRRPPPAGTVWQWSPTRISALGDGGWVPPPISGSRHRPRANGRAGPRCSRPSTRLASPLHSKFRVASPSHWHWQIVAALSGFRPPRSLSLSIRVAQSPAQCTNSRQCFAFQRNDRQWPVLLAQHRDWHRSNGRGQSSPRAAVNYSRALRSCGLRAKAGLLRVEWAMKLFSKKNKSLLGSILKHSVIGIA